MENKPNEQVENKTTTQEGTFTQEQVDKLVQSASSKAKHDILTQLGIENVNTGKELIGRGSLYDEVAPYKEKYEEVNTKYNELTIKERRNSILLAGADDKFVDYILHAAGDGDVAEYLEANPQFKKEQFNRVNSDLNYNGGSTKKLSEASSYEEYKEIRRKQDGNK